MAMDFTEAARLAGLDFKIDVIMNGRGKACAIFCGDPQFEYYEAAKYAALHYATRPIAGADIACRVVISHIRIRECP
jgi:nickel-dependent lactate racemase